MVRWETYSVLYFGAAGKTVKCFAQGIACEFMPRASLVTLLLSHCFLECWDTCGLMRGSSVMHKNLKQRLPIAISLKCEFWLCSAFHLWPSLNTRRTTLCGRLLHKHVQNEMRPRLILFCLKRSWYIKSHFYFGLLSWGNVYSHVWLAHLVFLFLNVNKYTVFYSGEQ